MRREHYVSRRIFLYQVVVCRAALQVVWILIVGIWE